MIAKIAIPFSFKKMLLMKSLLFSKEIPKAKLCPRMTQVMLMALMPSKQSNLFAVFGLLSKMDSILLTRENEINIFLLGVINFDINRLMNIYTQYL